MKISNAKRTAPSRATREVGTSELLKIVVTLADQVRRADPPSLGCLASWRERSLAALDDLDQDNGLIRACQIQRDAGALDGDQAFVYVHSLVSTIAGHVYDSDPHLKRIGRAIETAERAHGLMAGEYWRKGEAPDDVEKLGAAWARRADAILAAVFLKHGEADMADLLLADRASFMNRIKTGRRRMAAD